MHYNGSNSFLLFNAMKIYQFKAEDSEKKKKKKKKKSVFGKYIRRFFS